MEIESKYGIVKIFTDNIEKDAVSQIIKMANSPLGENANIRIMPDCHSGKGCTIGTTMFISDKICPNLIGVDIGCGVDLIIVKEDMSDKLEILDKLIRKKIPSGFNIHENLQEYNFSDMKCWDKLPKKAKERSQYSLGSLGGGNHFIEAYTNGIAVHSGSRNIGQTVATFYQKLAQKTKFDNKEFIDKDLAFLTGEERENYLFDMMIVQKFAVENRKAMLEVIVKDLKLTVVSSITSTHNYIDTQTGILRKGAISAKEGEMLVIPLNMRDGMLVCKGKGNKDWNYSAPHGAGRLYSRTKAKEIFTLEDYKKSMEGIFSSCVHNSTLDESPFAYKDYKEIMNHIHPTVEIIERLIPIFNFKA